MKLTSRFALAAAMLLVSAPAWATSVQIDLLGNPAVAALPGGATGWGFDVTSNGVFPLFTFSQFTPITNFGSYTDYLSSSFFFGADGATVSNPFDSFIMTGAGEFDIDPGTPLGASVNGSLQIFWDEYSLSPDDPNFDPVADLLTSGNSSTFRVSVTTGTFETPVATPEPGAISLIGVGLIVFAIALKKRAGQTIAFRGLSFALALTLISAASLRAQDLSTQIVPPNMSSAEQKALDIIRFSEAFGSSTCHPDSDTTKTGGCCGGPGNHGCISVSTDNSSSGFLCTKPSSNTLRNQGGGYIACNLPDASCDGGMVSSIQNISKSGPQDVTFYVTSDLHFFRPSWWVENQIRHVREMNEFSSKGLAWPGSPTETIGAPKGIIIAGDVTLDAGASGLGAYRLLYEPGTIDASSAYPVFFGLGNHDMKTQVSSSDSAKKMFQYLSGRMSCGGINFDSASGNYSWDWGRLHLIQLNTWAGDQTSLYVHSSDGLSWLQQDLANNVANSGRPVVIIQHYPFDSAYSGSGWWSDTDANNFIDKIKDYNIVAFIAGHTHVDNVGTKTYNDSKNRPIILDTFTNGTGGEEGRGDFIAVRYSEKTVGSHSDAYIDVATAAWDTIQGAYLGKPDQMADTDGPSPLPASGVQGYYAGLAGCRKRIDINYDDISSLFTLSPGGSGTNQTASITRKPGMPTLPSPLALELYQLSSAAVLSSPASFVDNCGGSSSNRFVQLTDDQVASLNAGNSVNVSLNFANSPGSVTFKMVALSPLRGVSPGSIDIVTASATVPPQVLQDPGPQSFQAYYRPSSPFAVTIEYPNPTTGLNWLELTSSASGSFNQFGSTTVNLHVNVNNLQALNTEQPYAIVHVTSTDDTFAEIGRVIVTVHIKAAVSFQITANPAGSYNPDSTTPALFTALLTHPVVPDPGHGGIFSPTARVFLNEATLDSTGAVVSLLPLAYRNVNGDQLCTEEFNNINAGFSPPTDTVIIGDVGDSMGRTGYCPAHSSGSSGTPFTWSSLPVGLHHFVFQYQGDSFFAPGTSAVVDYLLARPISAVTVSDGNGQSALVGTTFARNLQVTVTDTSSKPAPGIPVTFTAPSSGIGGFFPGGALTYTGRTDSFGKVSSLPFTANANPGSYQVTAAVSGVSPAVFNLVNLPTLSTPLLTASITSKTGAMNARLWTIQLANTGGFAAAAYIASLSLTQVAGTACTPALAARPLNVGDVASGASSTISTTIDFSSCATTARFTVTFDLRANGGSYQRTMSIGNQFP
jgi:hypothetical protein